MFLEIRQGDAQCLYGLRAIAASIVHEDDVAGRGAFKLVCDGGGSGALPVERVNVPADVGHDDVFKVLPYFKRKVSAWRAYDLAGVFSRRIGDGLHAPYDFVALLIARHERKIDPLSASRGMVPGVGAYLVAFIRLSFNQVNAWSRYAFADGEKRCFCPIVSQDVKDGRRVVFPGTVIECEGYDFFASCIGVGTLIDAVFAFFLRFDDDLFA